LDVATSPSTTASTAASVLLARAEAEIALGSLLDLGDLLRLAVPAEELQWRHTRLMRGLTSLPVVIT
jgi:cytochrome P450